MLTNNILKLEKSKHLSNKCTIIALSGGFKMNKRKIKKILSSRYYLLLLGILFIFFLLLFPCMLKMLNKKSLKYLFLIQPLLIVSMMWRRICLLDLVELYQFGERETRSVTEEYYFAFDKDWRVYIICIAQEDFLIMQSKFDEDPDNFSYRIEGYLFDLPDDVEELAKEMIPEVFGENSENIVENFDRYFLSTYLDTINSPYLASSEMIFIIVILLGLGCYFFISGVLRILKIGKLKQNKGFSEVVSELEKTSTIDFTNITVALTDSYLFNYGLNKFVNYQDINDIYYKNKRIYINADNKIVNFGKCNDKQFENIKNCIADRKNMMNNHEILKQ